MPTPQDMITAAQAAEILGVTSRTVRRRALAGEIPWHKIGPATSPYLFSRIDIEALKDAAA